MSAFDTAHTKTKEEVLIIVAWVLSSNMGSNTQAYTHTPNSTTTPLTVIKSAINRFGAVYYPAVALVFSSYST